MNDCPLIAPQAILMPIDMAGRKMKASLVFTSDWTYAAHVVVSHGGREALWSAPRHRLAKCRWEGGDRGIKPNACSGAANYILWYARTHVKNLESLAR